MTQDTAYSALFVFGDSLSDNGAIDTFFGGAFPPSVITGTNTAGEPVDFVERGVVYSDSFTNGDVYADIVPGLVNIPTDSSTFYDDFSGTNHAVGGAIATADSHGGTTTASTLEQQVSSFTQAISALPGSDAERAAFLATSAASIFIGFNDLNAIGRTATAQGFIDETILVQGVASVLGAISAQAQILAQSGVGTIVFNLLPGGSFLPNSNVFISVFGPETADLLDDVSASLNDGLKLIGAGLAAGGVDVQFVDFFGLAAEVQADPETFGFLTLSNALPNSDPVNTLLIDDIPIDQIGFIDPVHPTQELHEVFAIFQAMTLNNTQIDGDDGDNRISGGDGNQTIFASLGDDVVFGNAGVDLLFGGHGDDKLYGNADDDIVLGGLGRDKVFGGSGDDVLSGGSGRDKVLGGSGTDVVAGGAGDDFLQGNSGDDLIIDGLGSDIAFGGAGNDIFVYTAASSIGGVDGRDKDLFLGGGGIDTLLIVSDTGITDVDAFLDANNLRLLGVEAIEVLSQDALDSYDFGALAGVAETADLFGFL